MYRGFNVAPDLSVSPVCSHGIAIIVPGPCHPTCGVGAAHCVSAGSRSRAGPQNGRQCEHLPSQPGQPNPITPTTYKLPRLSNSRATTHPSSLSSSSKRSRVDSDLIESVFVKGGSVIVTRKSHHWAQHDPNNSHELLFHDDSLLMRFPNPSFNFFLATVELLIKASFAHFSTRPQTFFRRPRPIKHDQSCYIADSHVI